MSRALAICGGIGLNLLILAIPLLIHRDPILSPPLIAFFFLMSIFCGAEMLAGSHDDISSAHADAWSYLPHMSGVALLMVLWVSVYSGATDLSGVHLINTIAALAILAGIWLRYSAITTLKEKFLSHVSLTSEHALICTGIYRYLRHPSELGLLLIGLSVPILLGSTTGGLVFVLTLLPLISIRITVEDHMLGAAFPTEFAQYKSETPALLPRAILTAKHIHTARKDTI